MGMNKHEELEFYGQVIDNFKKVKEGNKEEEKK